MQEDSRAVDTLPYWNESFHLASQNYFEPLREGVQSFHQRVRYNDAVVEPILRFQPVIQFPTRR